MPPREAPYDVVVIGLGLAGLIAGLAATSRGARTLLVGKGYGTLRFRSGTIDVLGATTSADRLRRCAWMPQRDLLLPWREGLNLQLGPEPNEVSRQIRIMPLSKSP